MGTAVVVIVLVIVVLLALSPTIKHFKGEGGCCGGGSDEEKGFFSRFKKKKLDSAKIGEMEVQIEGMHCENCKNSVERAVNAIDGAVCRVNLRKNVARVEYSRVIEEEEIMEAIEGEGFEVKGIHKVSI